MKEVAPSGDIIIVEFWNPFEGMKITGLKVNFGAEGKQSDVAKYRRDSEDLRKVKSSGPAAAAAEPEPEPEPE